MTILRADSSADSKLDTVLMLPERSGAFPVAFACRETALAFVNESERWGKAELAMWLMGPYSQCAQQVPSTGDGVEPARTPLLMREIDARMVERMVQTARREVLETLASLAEPEAGATFAFTMLASGFVMRCEDRRHVSGWVPTTKARRLADRVLSLFAADYLTGRGEYETTLSVCPICRSVDFDDVARQTARCHRHGSGFFLPGPRRLTLPYHPNLLEGS